MNRFPLYSLALFCLLVLSGPARGVIVEYDIIFSATIGTGGAGVLSADVTGVPGTESIVSFQGTVGGDFFDSGPGAGFVFDGTGNLDFNATDWLGTGFLSFELNVSPFFNLNLNNQNNGFANGEWQVNSSQRPSSGTFSFARRDPTQLPEPTTTALLALGLLGAGFVRKRRTH